MVRTAFVEAHQGAAEHAKGIDTLAEGIESVRTEILHREGVLQPDGVSTVLGTDPNGKFFIPPESRFETEDYDHAPTVEKIADILIGRCPEFRHLKDARMAYYWKGKGGKSGGKARLSKATRSSGFTGWVTETDFIIFISADNCRDILITNWQMEALIYHELCHCEIEEKKDKDGEPTGEIAYVIAEHDVTVFHGEVHRYGAWEPSLVQNRNTWEQLAIAESSGG